MATNPWLQEDVEGTNKATYKEPDIGNWSSSDPAGWKQVAGWTKDAFGFSAETQFKSRADKAADDFKDEFGRWPSATELMQYGTYNQYVSNLAQGFPYMPPIFAVDGTNYYNDPYTGPRSFTNINTALGPGGIDAALEGGELNNSGVLSPKYQFTRDQFANIMQSLAPARGGGSGGRGGAGRTNRAFDRDQLIEAGTDRWKGLMLEDPADIERYVDQYIDRANSFWVGEGGSLDFDTFLVNKMRETSRYKTLYQKKAPELTEEEYMARYRGVAESFGINQTATRRETEAGLRSGVGQAGFQERVEKTREARLANTGRFSQQLASQMAQMGDLG